MPQFACPSCKIELEMPDEHAGATMVCPECKASVTVPVGADAISAEPIGAATSSTAVSERVPQSRRRDADTTTRTAAGIGIGMVLLIFAGIGCAGLVVVGILMAMLVPAVQKVRGAAERTETTNNMMQIGLAHHAHLDAFQVFSSPRMKAQPPAQVAPDLSWRVTILPFVEQNNVFAAFDKNVAWDHPNNRNMSNTIIRTYQSVWRKPADPTQTHFQYFTGPNTMFPDLNKGIRIAEITDGTANTILFAEAATPTPWAKPSDNAVQPNAPIAVPPEEFLVTFADGSVRLLHRQRVNDGALRMLIDPRDGKAIPPGLID